MRHGREVVIVEAVRTAVGRGHAEKGAFRDTHPDELLTTLLHELERTGGRLGLVTMCCGGGLGTATLIERV